MSYLEFNRSNLGKLRLDLAKVLEDFGADNNIDFNLGNIRFSISEFRVTVEAKVHGATTFSDSVFEAKVEENNLTLKAVVKDGNVYKLTGYKARRKKYPWSYTKNGKAFKGGEWFVYATFNKDTAVAENQADRGNL